ncbi:hypothetical protein QJS10_CPB22g00244 [Acorus calamus]|uniref:RNase H type-1 domain-containing protein n=1 Tax=Acorus calamus TaxID=4465 RepID=A0AAV9C155_ACOCL|nr:hypothetical protein QJS10_CPB22g00244 [Acorus calamus]
MVKHTDSFYHALPHGLSDYSALQVTICPAFPSGPRPFKYISAWETHPRLEKLIKQAWDRNFIGSPMYVLVKKLKYLKSVLKEWNRDTYGNIDDLLLTCQKRLERAQEASLHDLLNDDFIYDLNDDSCHDWAMIKSHLSQGNSRASKPLGIFTDPLPGHNQASTSGAHMVNMVRRGRQPSPQPSSSEDVTHDSLSEESEEEEQNEPFQLNLDNHDLAILYGEEEDAVLALPTVINIESDESGLENQGGDEEEEPFEEILEGASEGPEGGECEHAPGRGRLNLTSRPVRAASLWLLEGDKNSKFFYSSLKARVASNTIRKERSDPIPVLQPSGRLSIDDCQSLCAPIREQEIKDVLFSAMPLSSPDLMVFLQDGSLGDDRYAFGAVVRDAQGDCLTAIAARTRAASINILELQGILVGLRLCRGFHTKVWSETDSSMAIAWALGREYKYFSLKKKMASLKSESQNE